MFTSAYVKKHTLVSMSQNICFTNTAYIYLMNSRKNKKFTASLSNKFEFNLTYLCTLDHDATLIDGMKIINKICSHIELK